MQNAVIIIGGNAGARLVFNILKSQGRENILFLENFSKKWYEKTPEILPGKIEDNLDMLKNPDTDYFVATGDNHLRKEIVQKLISLIKKNPINVIHRNALIENYVQIGYGNLICAGSIINIGTKVGNGVIINTNAVVEHDNIIGDYSQISPNCCLAGYVKVGDLSYIYSGSTIIPEIEIGSRSIIAAGSVVIKNVESNVMVTGVPAEFKKFINNRFNE